VFTSHLVDQDGEVEEGRAALLGAVALEYPEPFEDLEAAASRVDKESWARLGAFTRPMSLQSWLSLRTTPHIREAAELLDEWQATAWKGNKRFPRSWEPWAYPMLGRALGLYLETADPGGQKTPLVGGPTTLVQVLASHLHARVRIFSATLPDVVCLEIEDEEFVKLHALPKKEVQERLYALFLEASKRFLGKKPRIARPDPWPTRERDLFFLAWKEVEGLGLEAIANRLYDRLANGHPTRFLLQGGIAQGLGKGAIRKALVLARERLRLD